MNADQIEELIVDETSSWDRLFAYIDNDIVYGLTWKERQAHKDEMYAEQMKQDVLKFTTTRTWR